MRLDGYFALQSDGYAGSFTTKTLRVAGDKLHLNYVAREGGSVLVEVLDEGGSIIPGFSRDACAPLTGDQASASVTWKEAGFEQLEGLNVKLKFYLRDAEVYAFETL